MRELAASPAWRGRFARTPVTWRVEPVEFYYDALAPRAAKVDLWLTDYGLEFPNLEAVAEWHRGAAFPPFLQLLPDEAARAAFVRDYLAAIAPHYPPRANGKVLLSFRRLFVIAYR
jgi:trans-aconitate 2-methyltransferase